VRNRFFKTAITITIITSIITGAAGRALAFAVPSIRTTNSNAFTSTGGGFVDGVFNSGDSIAFGNPSHDIYIDSTKIIANIDTSDTPLTGSIIVNQAASGGKLQAVTGGSARATLVLQDWANFTLSADSSTDGHNNYGSLDTILIGDNSKLTYNSIDGANTTVYDLNILSLTPGDASTLVMNGHFYFNGGGLGSITPLSRVDMNGNLQNLSTIKATTLNLNGTTDFGDVESTTINLLPGASIGFNSSLTATMLNIKDGTASIGQNADPTLTNINLQGEDSAVNIMGYTTQADIVNIYGSIGSTVVNSSDNQGSTLAGNIGTLESPILAVNFVADQTLGFDANNTPSNTLNIYAPITTNTNNTGILSPYNGRINIFNDIGTSGNNIKEVRLNYDATWSNRDAELVINSSDGNPRSIYAPITTTSDGHNTLTTNNVSVLFTQNIGDVGASLSAVNFNGTGNERISFSGVPLNVYAQNISLDGVTLEAQSGGMGDKLGLISDNDFTINNSTLRANNRTFALYPSPTLTLSGDITIETIYQGDDRIALDLTDPTDPTLHTNVDATGLTGLKFDLSSIPPFDPMILNITKGLGALPMGVTPTVSSLDGYWHYFPNGDMLSVIYDPTQIVDPGVIFPVATGDNLHVDDSNTTNLYDNGGNRIFTSGIDGLRLANDGLAIVIGNLGTGVVPATDIRGIDVNNSTGSSIEISSNNVSLGSITGGNIPVSVGDVTLSLTGLAPATAHGNIYKNDYSGLGIVTLTDASDSNIEITNTVKNAVFSNQFIPSNDGGGIFTILEGATGNIFNGSFGDDTHRFKSIILEQNTNATFGGATIAANSYTGGQGIQIGNDSVLTLDSTLNPITVTGTISSLSAPNEGTLSIIAKGNDITLQNTDQINMLNAVNILFKSPNNVTFTDSVYTNRILIQGVGGTAIFGQDSTVTSSIIAGGAIMRLNATGNDIEWTGVIDGYSDGVGALELTTNSPRNLQNIYLVNDIGSTHQLASILFDDNVSVMADDHAITADSFRANSGSSIYNMGIVSINGDATLDASTFNVIMEGGSLTTSGNISVAGTIEINNGIRITSHGPNGIILTDNSTWNHLGGDLPIITADNGIALAGNSLNIEGTATIYADITTTGISSLTLNSDLTLVGSLGSPYNALASIDFAGGGGQTLTIDADEAPRNIYAPIISDGNNIINVIDGEVTFFGNIGTSFTGLGNINLFNGNNVAFTSTLGNMDIYADITTSSINNGIISTSGPNEIRFHNNIGDSGALDIFNIGAITVLGSSNANINQARIDNAGSLTLTPETSDMVYTGNIDGVTTENKGSLAISGSGYDVTINNTVGSVCPVSNVSITSEAGNTIAFLSNVRADGNIDASNAGATVNFGGDIVSNFGNFLTSQSEFSVITGNTSVAGSVTLGNNASFGGDIMAPSGININSNTLTATGNTTITGDLLTTGDDVTGGVFAINGHDVTLEGSAGSENHSLTAIHFSSDNSLTLDATSSPRTIYAPITTYLNNKGSFSTTGGDVIFKQNIGNGNHLKELFLVGSGSENMIMDGVTDIYVNNIIHERSILHSSMNNLNIHSTNYTMNDATLDAEAKTITVTGGTATLTGDIVINASFHATNQIVLDLSSTTLIDVGITSLTYNVTGGSPAPNDTITMIKGLQNNIVPNISGSTAGWATTDTDGVLVFSSIAPSPPLAPMPYIYESEELYINPSITQQSILDIREQIQSSFFEDVLNNSNNLSDETNAILNEVQNDPISLDKIEYDATTNTTPQTTNNVVGDIVLIVSLNNITDRINMVTTPTIISPSFQNNLSVGNPVSTNDFINSVRVETIDQVEITNAPRALENSASQESITTVTNSSDAKEANNNTSLGEKDTDLGIGVASGDESERYGIWSNFVAGKASQKLLNNIPGFKANSNGAIIGFDTMLNDRVSIGIALSDIFTNIKHRDSKAGDRTSAKSWVPTIYTNYMLSNNWFIRGVAALTYNNIKSAEYRVTGINKTGLASAKYNMKSIGGDLSLGYNYRVSNNIAIIPSLGVRYTRVEAISYKEKGNTGQNKNITQSAIDSIATIGNITIMNNFSRYGMNFIPELHASIQYGLGAKTPTGTFRSELTNITNSFVGTKPRKLSGTAGIGLTISSSGQLEYGLGYDLSFAKKYLAQQAMIRLKFKF
jgi:hypothetical protein